jgi:hypothetical protein
MRPVLARVCHAKRPNASLARDVSSSNKRRSNGGSVPDALSPRPEELEMSVGCRRMVPYRFDAVCGANVEYEKERLTIRALG